HEDRGGDELAETLAPGLLLDGDAGLVLRQGGHAADGNAVRTDSVGGSRFGLGHGGAEGRLAAHAVGGASGGFQERAPLPAPGPQHKLAPPWYTIACTKQCTLWSAGATHATHPRA